MRKLRAQLPAVARELSCPSFAGKHSQVLRQIDQADMHTHIWRNEHPLRKLIVGEVPIEHGKVL